MEKIIILQLSRLGDLVQTVPLLLRLRTEYPKSHITLVCQKGFHGVLADCSYHDSLIPIPLADLDMLAEPDRHAAFPDLEPFSGIPAFRGSYDLLVNLTSDLGSSILCEKIEAKRKLGRTHTVTGELRLLGDWAKYLFCMVSHRTENLFNIVDIHMGYAGIAPARMEAALQVAPARRVGIEALLIANGRKATGPLIAIQSAASDLHRAWEMESFVALAKSIIEDYGAEILLLGDKNEIDRGEKFKSLLGLPVIDLVGKTTLAQLPAALQACEYLISNDTGTIHIAAAVGTRTLGLFFSTAYFSETAPYGEGHAVLQVEIPCSPCNAASRCPVQKCRDYLPVAAVRETLHWLMEEKKDPSRPPPAPRENLSLYRSRFLANGSLIYAPVHPESASGHYLAGLQGRMLWEGALGLARDPALEGAFARMRIREEWTKKRRGLEDLFSELEMLFHQGLELSRRLIEEFASEAPSRDRITLLHSRLARLSGDLEAAAKNGGLFGRFLQYELMDMDYAAYPEMARLLEEKYAKLAAWMMRFQSALARLPAA